jgi:IS30 family transposase
MRVDRDRLKAYLEQGLSLIQIGALENRDPSTVGYWVRKHGLEANGRDRYAPRGGIEREHLEALIRRELTIQEIAEELGLSASTVNYWLRRHDLKTGRAHGRGRSRWLRSKLASAFSFAPTATPRLRRE